MKKTLTSLLLPALAPLAVAAADAAHPNIILFMVDDMGWQDTSVPFADSITAYNRMYNTPNMQRLADSGMKFTSAYACPISSPTRCSLITGANSARHRVTNWTLQRDKLVDGKSETVDVPNWNYNGVQRTPGINNTYVGPSFVEDLSRAGYHTIHCGKAHWGAIDTPAESPHHWGFDKNITGTAAGGLATYLSERNYGHDKDGNPLALNSTPGLERYWGTGTFLTEALTQEAIKALDKAKKYEQPWFLYMSHYAVHIPIDRDERYYQSYIDKGLAPKDAAYASLVEGMDKSLGDILDWVEANGEADNTIIIFMADNGGLAASEEWREGPLHTQNSPLRSGKGSLLEGGVREPMIVRWPGKTQPGTSTDKYVIIEDFYPTILEMANVKPVTVESEGHTLDGVSFVPLIDGSADPSADRALIWNLPNIWGPDGPGISLGCSIRKNQWKLVYNYETGEKELYDVKADISESKNLVKKYPKVADRLSRDLGEALRSMDAQRPTFKATGKPCPWPDERR